MSGPHGYIWIINFFGKICAARKIIYKHPCTLPECPFLTIWCTSNIKIGKNIESLLAEFVETGRARRIRNVSQSRRFVRRRIPIGREAGGVPIWHRCPGRQRGLRPGPLRPVEKDKRAESWQVHPQAESCQVAPAGETGRSASGSPHL